MNAPINRVLPTPVASAKQSEGKSRSKSVTVGNSLLMAASALATSTFFAGGTISVIRSRISSERRCGGRNSAVLRWRSHGDSWLHLRAQEIHLPRWGRSLRKIFYLQAVIVLAPLATGEHSFGNLLNRKIAVTILIK